MGLCGQALVGPGTGVDLEDFDRLGDVVLDYARYVSLAETNGSNTIYSIHDV